jgi:hypothetical protein
MNNNCTKLINEFLNDPNIKKYIYQTPNYIESIDDDKIVNSYTTNGDKTCYKKIITCNAIIKPYYFWYKKMELKLIEEQHNCSFISYKHGARHTIFPYQTNFTSVTFNNMKFSKEKYDDWLIENI